jgi:ribose transport system substrate-binding protein
MTSDGDERRALDPLLERLDTYGIGRRQFAKLLAGSAVALGAAGALTAAGTTQGATPSPTPTASSRC